MREPSTPAHRYLDLVRGAASAIRPYVVRTPLVLSRSETARLGFPVYLKLENLQVTGAFKIRGATNAVLALKERGVAHVVAASSGSHAMGVALAARVCGLRATIVMSESSPEVKRRKVRAYGADLRVEGATFDDSYRLAMDLARASGAVFLSGIEDEMVMAGHGTMGLEILEDLPGVDLVACPVGGGGAISGLLMALKGARGPSGSPAPRVWGVQAAGAPSMKVSLERGEVTEIPRAETMADAIAVRRPGRPAFHLVRELADGITTVTDAAMLEAVGRLAWQDKIVAEPAGAAPFAVDWDRVLDRRPKAAVFIVTGGNISKDLFLRALSEVTELG